MLNTTMQPMTMHGPFRVWAPQFSQVFLNRWTAPMREYKRRNGRSWFFFGGCAFWFFILFAVGMFYCVYLFVIPMLVLTVVFTFQALEWIGEGIGWLAWGWWHRA